MSGSASRVLLVCPPFAAVDWGSLGLATLKAILDERGIACDVLYPNLDFARWTGVERYRSISQLFDAEVVFTATLFGDVSTESVWERYARLGRDDPGERLSASRSSFLEIAGELAPRLVDATLARVSWERYDVVGFTTGFHQTVAALALASAVRRLHPEKIVLLGGAGCDGETGPALLRHFDCLDVVVAGEADGWIAPLIESLRRGEPVDRWPGVFARRSDRVAVGGPGDGSGVHGRGWSDADNGLKVDLDDLPVPDFDDYFDQLGDLPLGEPPRLPFESSRGCWWGQKSLCSFCGLNGTSLAYRTKSPERVLAEIDRQVSRYGTHRLMAVDNILDLGFLDTLLPELEARRREHGLEIFYETKSNLKTDQVRRLRRAGINEVQPGIESFSDHVLELMAKGTTGYNQVRFLRDCDSVGLVARYGILWANPGETAEDYVALRELVPFIRHLSPPRYVQPIALERFSPYFLHPERFGIRNVRAAEIYRVAFADRDLDYDSLAYLFSYDHDFDQDAELHRERARFLDAVEAWRAEHRPNLLIAAELDGDVLVADRRNGHEAVIRLDGDLLSVFRACFEPTAERELARRTGLPRSRLLDLLALLESRRLVLAWSGRDDAPVRYLSLPVPVEPRVFYDEVLAPRTDRLRTA